jgi:hypothetical protein
MHSAKAANEHCWAAGMCSTIDRRRFGTDFGSLRTAILIFLPEFKCIPSKSHRIKAILVFSARTLQIQMFVPKSNTSLYFGKQFWSMENNFENRTRAGMTLKTFQNKCGFSKSKNISVHGKQFLGIRALREI